MLLLCDTITRYIASKEWVLQCFHSIKALRWVWLQQTFDKVYAISADNVEKSLSTQG
jgi:hypothetical protein